MSVVPLVTARLRIRRLTPEDAEALHRIYGDPETMRYVGRDGRPRDRARTEEILAELIRIERRLGFGLWAAYPENAASIRMMEKLPMRPAGTAEAYGRTLVRYEADATSSPR